MSAIITPLRSAQTGSWAGVDHSRRRSRAPPPGMNTCQAGKPSCTIATKTAALQPKTDLGPNEAAGTRMRLYGFSPRHR